MNNKYSTKGFFNRISFFTILFFINLIITSSMNAQYKLAISNGRIVSDKSYDFDIFIKSSNNEFIISSYQCALTLNKTSVNNGQISFSYVNGSSELLSYPENSIGTRTESGQIKLCFASNVNTNSISTTLTKLGTFRLQNTTTFNFDSLKVAWDFDGNIRTFITNSNFLDVTLPENFSNLDQPLPTPVERIDISIEMNNEKPLINWISFTELNVQKYEIERMNPDKSEWEYLGSVNASSTSSSVSKYNFLDKTVSNSGQYKYRLKIIDLDGTFTYSGITEINVKKTVDFHLYQNYPNPFNPTTTIKYTIPSASQIKLVVYNTLGQEIAVLINEMQNSGMYENSFEAINLPSGNYFYVLNAKSISDGQEFRDVRKMIVMK
jgi:hypothetical protein